MLPRFKPDAMVTSSEYYDLHLASAMVEKKAYAQALPILKGAREKSPTNIFVLFNLGHCYLELAKQSQDKAQRAEYIHGGKDVFLRIHSLNPDLVVTYFKLGKLSLMENRMEEAEAYYQQGLEVEPDNAGLLFNLAGIYDQRKEIDKAMTLYQKAIEADPQFVFAYNNLGLLLEQNGKMKEAEQAYKLALAGDPTYHFAKLNLGNLYAEAGRLDEAMAQYQSVIQDNPEDGWAHLYAGNIQLRIGNFEKAAAEYKLSTEYNPDYPLTYYLLAVSLERLQRVDEALKAGLIYMSLEPNGAYAQEMQNMVLTLQMRKAASLKLIQGGTLLSHPNGR